MKELNEAVRVELEVHNNTPLTGRTQSRRELFEEIERRELRPLPHYPYLMKQQRTVTVHSNNHVCLRENMHYYSVPYQHMGKKVKLLYSDEEVDIYLKYEKIASHKRNYIPNAYSTITEHLATSHRFLTDWNEEKFIARGNEIHAAVGNYLKGIFDTKPHPEQAYKSCSGILSFAHKVGKQRLINACKRGSEYKVFGYNFLVKILENKLDGMEPEEPLILPNSNHTNIRGSNYYK